MKKKLKLNELEINSFVTAEKTTGKQLLGGNRPSGPTTGFCVCVTCDLACRFTEDPDLCVVRL